MDCSRETFFILMIAIGIGFLACKTESTERLVESSAYLNYDEKDKLPGDHWVERLSYVSQKDKLVNTIADEARCSAAATLSGYLILGGDFNKVASSLNLPSSEITFENIHLAQEKLYHMANIDGEPGIYGTTKPIYDDQGKLIDWDFREEDEYHKVVELLGLKVERIFSLSQSKPLDKQEPIERLIGDPLQQVFVVGVMEDLEEETFYPMDESIGNHYILIFHQNQSYYALDSWKTPGKKTLSKLSGQQVKDHLFKTHNAIYALSLNGPD